MIQVSVAEFNNLATWLMDGEILFPPEDISGFRCGGQSPIEVSGVEEFAYVLKYGFAIVGDVTPWTLTASEVVTSPQIIEDQAGTVINGV